MARVVLVCLLLLPLSAFASISVREVMYDVPGTDTKREWVEFVTDTPITDIRAWRFVEGGVKHKITGTTGVVPAGTTFILASDAATFRAEHPSYTGLVFDTAMSLSNAGETVALLDEKGVTVLTHAYTPTPKPVAEKTVTQVTQKAVHTKSAREPRVLGAHTEATSTVRDLHAAVLESTSPTVAWLSFVFLGLIMLLACSTLAYLQFKK